MIDADGFRANVGLVLTNHLGQVLWARRIGQNAWQFPQGGINEGESPREAMFRELKEELGLEPDDVSELAQTQGWLRYRIPPKLRRKNSHPTCIGQKQKWFLLQIKDASTEARIHFDDTDHPEFQEWSWVSYWYPVSQVVLFKRDVYRKALKELARWVPVAETVSGQSA